MTLCACAISGEKMGGADKNTNVTIMDDTSEKVHRLADTTFRVSYYLTHVTVYVECFPSRIMKSCQQNYTDLLLQPKPTIRLCKV